MKTTSRCLAIVVATLSFGLPVMAQPQRQTEAKRILNNVFRVYSRLASYQDEGILITTKDEATGGTIEKMPFKTFFKRPELIRFEWIDFGITKLGQTNLIWFNGKEAFMYWEPDYYEKKESLHLAIAGATGITSRTVTTVFDLLLLDDVGNSTLKTLDKISLLGEEMFEGVRCYHIKAIEASGEPFEVWIGKNDFLLRKLRREMKSSGLTWIYEEIRRKIQVNQSIQDVVFNYKPPIPLTPPKEVDAAAVEKLLNPDPPTWSEFRSDEGRFSVLMPQKPVSQKATTETPQGRFEQHIFLATHMPFVCMVAYGDLPKTLLASNNVDGLFDEIRDLFVKQVSGKLASQNSLSLDGHPGRDIKVHMLEGELRLRLFMVGDRLYQLSIIMAGKSEEEALNKFFASFKLISPNKPIAVLPYRSRLIDPSLQLT